MLGAVYYGAHDIRLENVPDPVDIGPGEVLLRIIRASLCGTDVDEYTGGPHLVPLTERHPVSGHLGPLRLGHEMVGEVVARGDDVCALQIGDRVVPGSGVSCGDCAACAAGRTNLCRSYWTIGLHGHGGLCEQLAVPASICRKVSDGCPDDLAVMAQPLAVALHAVDRARIEATSTVAVYGAGSIGAFALAALATMARTTIAVDVHDQRLHAARRLGVTETIHAGRQDPAAAVLERTGGLGADVVVEASGTADGLAGAARSVRPGGNLHLVGLYGDAAPLPLTRLVLNEVDVTTSKVHNCAVDLPHALQLLGADTDRWYRLVAESLPLDEVVTGGFDRLARGELPRKVVVHPH